MSILPRLIHSHVASLFKMSDFVAQLSGEFYEVKAKSFDVKEQFDSVEFALARFDSLDEVIGPLKRSRKLTLR